MPDSSQILINLFAAVSAALVMGYVAHRLKLPSIVGYLLAGVLVGPYTPGFRSSMEVMGELSEIGVAFLMFAVGTHVNLRNLRHVQRIGILGAILQVSLSVVLGALVARSLGVSWVSGVFFGTLIALSSTAVAVKILTDRKEMESLHGRIALSVLLVQDLLVVPMVLVLPVLSNPGPNILVSILLAMGKAALLLGVSIFVGTRLMPRFLDKIAETGSRELMLFTATCIALGAAIGTHQLGVSAAVGAFVGGLIVAETHLSRQVSSTFSPLRDLFSIFFFISVGMFLDFRLLLAAPIQTVVSVLVAVVGKGLIMFGITRVFGYGSRVSLMVAVSLAQVGEFSFILAGLGLHIGLIDDKLYSLVVSSALISIFVSPFLVSFGGRSMTMTKQKRILGRLLDEAARAVEVDAPDNRHGHTIVAGYGRVGRELVETLEREGVPVLVIEHSPALARELGHKGIDCVYGDIADRTVLYEAGVRNAALLAVTVPDPDAVRHALEMARVLNPTIQAVVRIRYAHEMTSLQMDGTVFFVHPEFEAGMHFARHALSVYGLESEEAEDHLESRRAKHYEVEGQ